MTIGTTVPVLGTTLSPKATLVTVSYLYDDSYYISTAESINDSSPTPIMTAIIYLNYCASNNTRKLRIRSGLISKYVHLGNELGQPDVELGQSNVNKNPTDEPSCINLVFYFDINLYATLFRTMLVTATAALNFFLINNNIFPF